MKSRFLQALFLVLLGLMSGYVWSEPILTFVRSLLPSDDAEHRYRTLTYDGWLS